MGLIFALKQGIKVITILEFQWHPPTLMFMLMSMLMFTPGVPVHKLGDHIDLVLAFRTKDSELLPRQT